MIWIFVECGERHTSIPLFLRGWRTRERWVREMTGRDGDGRWTRRDGPGTEREGDVERWALDEARWARQGDAGR